MCILHVCASDEIIDGEVIKMEITTCANCGRLFKYIRGDRICTKCQKQLDDKFTEVKKYVRENPNVGINELSKEMDVSIRQIHRWVREERLVFSDDSPIGIPCECCGVTIKTGRYCDSCRITLQNGFKEAAGVRVREREKPRKSTDNKMRFLE